MTDLDSYGCAAFEPLIRPANLMSPTPGKHARLARIAPLGPQLIVLLGHDVQEERVQQRTVQRWALEDASMPALRLGRTVRFPRAELERWFDRGTQRSRKSKAITGK